MNLFGSLVSSSIILVQSSINTGDGNASKLPVEYDSGSLSLEYRLVTHV